MESDTGDVTSTSRDNLELVPDQVELQMQEHHQATCLALPRLARQWSALIGLLKGGGNYVTNLNRAWVPEVVPPAVAVLLGRQQHPDLEIGRVPRVVCAVDGDIGCGAVSAALSLTAETVTWSDFRWENGIEEPHAPEGFPDAVTFDRRQYEQELERAVARVSELPYDEAEHTPRRFLWPWQWGWRLPREN